MSGIRGFLRLSLAQKATALRALLFLGLAEAGLRLFPLPRVARWMGVSLTPGPGAAGPVMLTAREIDRLTVTYQVLTHRGVSASCLRRALVLGNVLRVHEPVLRIGVTKHQGRVRAHAWTEVGELRLNGGSGFTVLERPLGRIQIGGDLGG